VGEVLEFNNSFMPATGGYCQGGDLTNSIGWVVGEAIEFTATEEGAQGGHVGHTDYLPYVTGYFYCPGKITVQDQMQIAGAFMAGDLDLSGDVGIYQVPNLINYIPPLMPGAQMELTFQNREWRRVF